MKCYISDRFPRCNFSFIASYYIEIGEFSVILTSSYSVTVSFPQCTNNNKKILLFYLVQELDVHSYYAEWLQLRKLFNYNRKTVLFIGGEKVLQNNAHYTLLRGCFSTSVVSIHVSYVLLSVRAQAKWTQNGTEFPFIFQQFWLTSSYSCHCCCCFSFTPFYRNCNKTSYLRHAKLKTKDFFQCNRRTKCFCFLFLLSAFPNYKTMKWDCMCSIQCWSSSSSSFVFS